MKRGRLILKEIFIITILSILTLFFVFEAKAQYTDTQKRLMARRAARVDALRNFTETIHGIKIDATTTVKNFVTQDDKINATLSGKIQEAQEIDYREQADGTAEVTLEIPTDSVENIIGRKLDYDYRTIRATGNGAPPK